MLTTIWPIWKTNNELNHITEISSILKYFRFSILNGLFYAGEVANKTIIYFIFFFSRLDVIQ